MTFKTRISSLLLLISILDFTIPSIGQGGSKPGLNGMTITVSGMVRDSTTDNPIEYANVIIFTLKDSQLVSGASTNEKGKFVIEKINPGRYILKASFMGYNTFRTIISLSSKISDYELDAIYMTSSVASMKEFTVVGEKPLVEYKLDKKVINVEKNINTAGGTAVDVLQNVPSVTVDYDGNVSIRGTTNVTILIDGRPSGITGTKLDQIPASSIESIEMITNPSARYNPEGMGGIINIKLKKKKQTGLNGLASVNIGTKNKYSGSLNLNYNIGKVNFFGSYDFRYNERTAYGNVDRTTWVNDTASRILQRDDMTMQGLSNNVKAGLDYAINRKNTITFAYLFSTRNSEHTEFSTNREYDYLNKLVNYFESDNTEGGDDHSDDFTLNYKKTFNRRNQELTADVIYNKSDWYEESGNILQYFNLDFTPMDTAPERQETVNDSKSNRLTIQANYIHPLQNNAKLELGLQSINRYSDNFYDYKIYDYSDPGSPWKTDTLLTNRFIYDENIQAVYGTYSKELSKYSFQAGLRLEQAFTGGDSRTMDTVYKNDYFSLFPSFHITRKFEKSKQEIQFSYSRRINRPNAWWMNPFVDKSNPLVIRYGNPALRPEYINSLELGHTKSWKNISLYTNLFYRQINDVIKMYAFLDSNGILNMTSANLSSGQSYGVEFVYDQKITSFWKATLNFSYFRTVINGDNMNTNLTNDNYSWTSSLNTGIGLPKNIFIQLTGFYRGPMVTPQGEMKSSFSMDIAAKKDVFKDKGTITFRLSDIFNTMQFDNISTGEGFTATQNRKRETRTAYFGFSWKINQGIKQTARKKIQENNMQDENYFE